MSCLAKSHLKFSSNNDMDKYYLDEDVDDFEFQYVPVNHFKHIVKDVRRQKIKEEEERAWALFLKEQEQDYKQTYVAARRKPPRTLAESIEDVDRELQRLEADTLPETFGQLNKNYQEKNVSTKSAKNSPSIKENSTGSNNLLLTIPEEENVCYTHRSSTTHKHSKSQIQKTCSDQTFKRNNGCTHDNYYNVNDLNYNSSPDISPDRFIDENDSVPVRPDPDAAVKILSIQKKISIVLNSISYELDRVPLPDGHDDLLRRQQRVAEFSTRLSRNYLYDLGRQISDIQRHVKAIAPNRKMKLTRRGIILHMQAVEQKLITAHQLLLTALTAYWKHIPTSVLKNHPGKLKEILQLVMHLRDICAEVKITPDFYCSGDNGDVYLRKDTENQCALILSKFRMLSDNESQAPSHRTRSTTTSQKKKQKSRKALSNRLSMYTMDMRLARHHQPKKSYSMFHLSKGKKQNLASKQQRNTQMDSKKSHPALLTKSVSEHQTVGRANKISLPVKEDDIQTIMETVPSNVDVQSPRSSVMTRIPANRGTRKSISIDLNTKESKRLSKSRLSTERKETSPREEESLSNLLPVIGDLLSMVQNKTIDPKSMPMTSIDMLYNLLHKHQSLDDQEKVLRSSENMQLICYTESKEKEKNIDAEKHEGRFNDVSCQANHLKNGKKCNLSVSESALQYLLDYSSQYRISLKENPLYTSNSQNKPWDVVGWIADKLVEELIAELSDDFQLEDVIQKLFELEFQEF